MLLSSIHSGIHLISNIYEWSGGGYECSVVSVIVDNTKVFGDIKPEQEQRATPEKADNWQNEQYRQEQCNDFKEKQYVKHIK